MAPNRPQGDAQQRIICPNCHANNFAGQAQCWQCRAPLAIAGGSAQPYASRATAPPVAPPVQRAQAVPTAVPPRTGSSRPSALLLIGVAMMTFVIVLLNMRSQTAAPGAGRTTTQEIETRRTATAPVTDLPSGQEDGANRISPSDTPTAVPTGDAHDTSAASGGGDALEDAAKRVISREAPKVGLPPPAAVSPDGQVHLRTGGTISADEWNEARRKLQESTLLKEPAPPAPF